MLLKNVIMEEELYNGEVSDLQSLHFNNKDDPLVDGPKEYVIVDISAYSVPKNEKLVPVMTRNCIILPIAS